MLTEITAKEIDKNTIDLIADEWMLISAGDKNGYNMMTASWGGMGEMWGKDVAVCVIRPQRYTYEFVEKSEKFTLSFYGDNKKIHAICGKKSGRNTDKAKEAGLDPVFTDGTVTFKQARMTLVCRKLYKQQIDPDCFTDKSLLSNYNGDYHYVFVGEIEKIYINSDN